MLGLLAQDYNYTYSVPSGNHTGLAIFSGVFQLVWLAVAVVVIIGLWKVFEKAGKPGWAAIVPFYNGWVLAEIAGKPGWWGLVPIGGIIPVLGIIAGIVGLVLYVIIALEIAKAFGKDTVFAVVGLILFSFVGFPILGFGDAKYTAPTGANKSAAAPPPTAA
jgi:uncharacterized membrane protein